MNTITFTPLMQRYMEIKAMNPSKPKRGFYTWYKWIKNPAKQ